MIIHECIEIFDKNIVSFRFSSINNKAITKNANADGILFFSILYISLTLNGNLISLKSSFLAKSFSAFVVLALGYILQDLSIGINTI